MPTAHLYTFSLHDALPIFLGHEPAYRLAQRRRALAEPREQRLRVGQPHAHGAVGQLGLDRKSTRLNSSHLGISYAVFCLKKKRKRRRNVVMYQEHNYSERG